jgi:hypothetical protein
MTTNQTTKGETTMKVGTKYNVGKYTGWECVWTDGKWATLAIRLASGGLYGCLSVSIKGTQFEEAR